MAIAWLMSHSKTNCVCGRIFTLCVNVPAYMSVVINSGILHLKIGGEMPSCELGIFEALSLIMAVCIVFFSRM